MFTIIGCVVCTLFVMYIILRNKYCSNTVKTIKNPKNVSEASKLVKTLKKKIDKSMKDLRRNMQSPQEIQEEIFEYIDAYRNAKLMELKNSLEFMITTKNQILNSIKNMQGVVITIKEKIKNLDKTSKRDIKLGSSYVMRIHNLENAITNATVQKDKLIEKIENAKKDAEYFNGCIDIKKTDILTKMNSFVNANGLNVDLNINIDDIIFEGMNELEVRNEFANIDTSVNNINTSEEYVDPKYEEEFLNMK